MPFDFVKERRSGLQGWAFCLRKVPHFGVWKHAFQGVEEQRAAGPIRASFTSDGLNTSGSSLLHFTRNGFGLGIT